MTASASQGDEFGLLATLDFWGSAGARLVDQKVKLLGLTFGGPTRNGLVTQVDDLGNGPKSFAFVKFKQSSILLHGFDPKRTFTQQVGQVKLIARSEFNVCFTHALN